jgi:chloride channel protein, CIC family
VGKLVGILSEYDLENYRGMLASVLVRSAMIPNPVTASPSATLEHAVALLRRYQIGALPVVDRGKLVGIITAGDLGMTELRPLPEWDPRTRRRLPVQFTLPASD